MNTYWVQNKDLEIEFKKNSPLEVCFWESNVADMVNWACLKVWKACKIVALHWFPCKALRQNRGHTNAYPVGTEKLVRGSPFCVEWAHVKRISMAFRMVLRVNP